MQALLILVYLAIAVLAIAGTWKTFVKAGQPGWGVLIPIYKHLPSRQGRGTARMVAHPVVCPHREHRD